MDDLLKELPQLWNAVQPFVLAVVGVLGLLVGSLALAWRIFNSRHQDFQQAILFHLQYVDGRVEKLGERVDVAIDRHANTARDVSRVDVRLSRLEQNQPPPGPTSKESQP